MGSVHAKGLESSSPVGNMDRPEVENHKDVILSTVPVKVKRIHIDGLGRTRNDAVTKQVQHVFNAGNFEELVRSVHEAKIKLDRLGIFKNVKIFIDTSKGDAAKDVGYEVTFTIKETRRIVGGVNTLVGTNEGSLLFGMKLPNLFGRAEKFSAEYTYGTKNASGYNLTFTKPINTDINYLLSLGAYKFTGDYPWSGYKEVDRGVSADFTFPSMLGAHNIRWEGVWRDLQCLSGTTSFTVREQAGHSLKSAIKHSVMRDSRDDPMLPNEGTLFKLMTEVAGIGGRLGGDADFIKQDLEFQANKSLPLGSVLQLSLAGGIVKTLHPSKDIRINDKFFIGGPLTLRGFNLKGCGPHESGNAIGADAYCQGGIHLYTPLPFRPGKGGFGELFRSHFFINAGSLTNLNFSTEVKENLWQLADSLRWSYGAGVVLRMGRVARLELNYCIPMKSQRGDSINPGLQFGIGVSFL